MGTYRKAVECDYCGDVQLGNSKGTFKAFLNRIKWHIVINGNGTTNEFCSTECRKHYADLN